MIKIRSIFLVVFFVIFTVVIQYTDLSADIPEPNANIAIVYATGYLGDKGFNDAAHQGILDAESKYPGITIDQYEPDNLNNITDKIEAYAVNGTYDLIIGMGFGAEYGINISALAYPSQKFAIIDVSSNPSNQPNVASIIFKEYEGSFLVGAMAAMVTAKEDLAFLGGMNIPLINEFLAGYRQGARYINSDIVIRHDYSPNPAAVRAVMILSKILKAQLLMDRL